MNSKVFKNKNFTLNLCRKIIGAYFYRSGFNALKFGNASGFVKFDEFSRTIRNDKIIPIGTRKGGKMRKKVKFLF